MFEIREITTGRTVDRVEIPPKYLRRRLYEAVEVGVPAGKVCHKLAPVGRKPWMLCVVPHLFVGGAETQLFYLIERLGWPCRLVVLHHKVWNGSSMWDEFQHIAECRFLGEMSDADRRDALLLEMERADVVVFHGTGVPLETARRLATLPRLVQIVHTGDDTWSFNHFQTGRDILDAAICVAEWIQKRLGGVYPEQADKIHRVWNGVDARQFAHLAQRPEAATTIGYLGRIAPGKNVESIITALEYLPQQYEFVIQGWGDSLPACEKLAGKFGSRVCFLESSTDRRPFFEQVGILCLPSDHEGNSMVVIEALLAGVRVAATPVGGVPELHRAGVQFGITETTKPFDVANAIVAASELPDTVVAENRSFAKEHLSATAMAAGYRRVIEESFTQPERVLISSEGGLGDLLMTTPAIRQMKQERPGLVVDAVLPRSHRDLASYLPLLDSVTFAGNVGEETDRLGDTYDEVIQFRHGEVWRRGGHIIERRAALAGVDVSDRVPDFVMPEGAKAPNLPDSYMVIHRSTAFACKTAPDAWWAELVAACDLPVVELVHGEQTPVAGTIPCRGKLARAALVLQGASRVILVDSVFVHLCVALGISATVLYGGSTSPDWCGYALHRNLTPEFECDRAATCECAKLWSIRCPYDFRCVAEGWSIEEVLS